MMNVSEREKKYAAIGILALVVVGGAAAYAHFFAHLF
jgi:hypothetical protein